VPRSAYSGPRSPKRSGPSSFGAAKKETATFTGRGSY